MWNITVSYKDANTVKYENCSTFRVIEHGYFMIVHEDEIQYISPYNVYDIKAEKVEE